MLKLQLVLLFVLMRVLAYSQIENIDGKFPDEYKSNFDLIGNVKSAEIIETQYESIEKLINKTDQYFNKAGYLTMVYKTYRDNFKFLEEENSYNTSNQLIHKIEYSRKTAKTDSGYIFIKEFEDYQTKYLYDSVGNLLTKYEKSHRDEDFFVTEKYTYKNKLLTEQLHINQHFGRNRLEWTSGNFLIRNTYNPSGLLVQVSEYDYEARDYDMSIIDGVEHFKPVIQDVKTLDTTNFILTSARKYVYNSNNQLISKDVEDYINDGLFSINVSYEYFGTKQSKITMSNPLIDNFISLKLKDYVVVSNDTLIKSESTLSKQDPLEDFSTLSNYGYEYNLDGSYSKLSYKNNEVFYTEKYNTHKRLFEKRDANNDLLLKINYQYDAQGNWIFKQTIYIPEMREIELVERKIEYYN